MAKAPVYDFTKYNWSIGDTTAMIEKWNAFNNAVSEFTKDFKEYAQDVDTEQRQVLAQASDSATDAANSASSALSYRNTSKAHLDDVIKNKNTVATDKQTTIDARDRTITEAEAAKQSASDAQSSASSASNSAQTTTSDRQVVRADKEEVEDLKSVVVDRHDKAVKIYNGIDAVNEAATSASNDALNAKQQASYAVDSLIPGTDEYSARHYAQKAREVAAGALIFQGTWNAGVDKDFPARPEHSAYWLVKNTPVAVTIAGERYRDKDMLVYSRIANDQGGYSWQFSKIDNTDSVTSVAGKSGAVELVTTDLKDSGSASRADVGQNIGNVMKVGAFGGPTDGDKFVHTGNMAFPAYRVNRGYVTFSNAVNDIDPMSCIFYRASGTSTNSTTVNIPNFPESTNTCTLVFVFSATYANRVNNVTWNGRIVWANNEKPQPNSSSATSSHVVVTMVWLDWPGYWLAMTQNIEGGYN